MLNNQLGSSGRSMIPFRRRCSSSSDVEALPAAASQQEFEPSTLTTYFLSISTSAVGGGVLSAGPSDKKSKTKVRGFAVWYDRSRRETHEAVPARRGIIES